MQWLRRIQQASASILVVALLAACSNKPASEAPKASEPAPSGGAAQEPAKKQFEGVNLKAVMIGGGNYEQQYEAIPQWEAETGARVEIVFKGNGFDVDKKLKTDFAAGTADYDVVWDHTSFFSQYTSFLEPLDNLMPADQLQAYIPRILDAGRRDGKLWLIPRHSDISALFYRKDLFEDPKEQEAFKAKYGYDLQPPATWKEFEDMAIFFTRPEQGLYGTVFAGKEEGLTGRFYEQLISEGGQFVQDGKVAFNSDAGIKVAERFQRMYQAGALPRGMVNFLWDDVANAWVQGTVAFSLDWYGWYGYFNDPASSKVAGKIGMARQPRGENTQIHGGWAGAHGYSVTRSSKNKEAAASLILFLTNYANSYEESSKFGFLPVRTDVMDQVMKDAASSSEPLDREKVATMQLQLSEDFKTPPLVPTWIPMSNALYPRLQAVILGDKTPKAALDEAAADAQKALDDQ